MLCLKQGRGRKGIIGFVCNCMPKIQTFPQPDRQP